ncbi:hypothetical protein HZS_1225 [Henneguya salminicola]|nr:hypothetical protein HZS_1225 [Henneguya salminicola]
MDNPIPLNNPGFAKTHYGFFLNSDKRAWDITAVRSVLLFCAIEREKIFAQRRLRTRGIGQFNKYFTRVHMLLFIMLCFFLVQKLIFKPKHFSDAMPLRILTAHNVGTLLNVKTLNFLRYITIFYLNFNFYFIMKRGSPLSNDMRARIIESYNRGDNFQKIA